MIEIKRYIKRTIRIALLILGFGVIVAGYLKVFPEILYKNKFHLDNYTIYSNNYIDSSIVYIIDTATILLENNLIDRQNHKFDVLISNSYPLFWAHTFLNKKPTGASEFVTNNIYIANGVIENNYCYNFEDKKKEIKGRSLHSVIAHESVHIIIRKELGTLKYLRILKKSNWKVEGFCEWIAFNNIPIERQIILEIIRSDSYVNNPYDRYKLYRALVDYLIRTEEYTFIDLMTSDDNFEFVINKYATQ
jgi:hypothetical protein